MIVPGTIIHQRYRILRLIGQGGMGAVYEAYDQRLGCAVALKQLLTTSGGTTQAAVQQTFEREARMLAGLRHPALPRVIDAFVEQGRQFLVMEYIPGEDLGALLARSGTVPTEQALAWAERLLDALAYLHHQQPPVIHRDIKPANLKLTPNGEIVLLDFGLAKGAFGQPNSSASVVSVAPSVFGYTPQYAPLEQLRGMGTDPRSDLYALAATLYHLLTGRPPVSAMDRAAAVLNRQPDPLVLPQAINPRVPASVGQALMRALALNIDGRPPNAETMRQSLAAARGKQSSGLKPWMAIVAAVTAIVVLIVAVGLVISIQSILNGSAVSVVTESIATSTSTSRSPTSTIVRTVPTSTIKPTSTLDSVPVNIGAPIRQSTPVMPTSTWMPEPGTVTATSTWTPTTKPTSIREPESSATPTITRTSRPPVTPVISITEPMPNLIGKTEAQARAVLRAYGIAPERIIINVQGRDKLGDAFDQYKSGEVISTEPGYGKQIPDSGVIVLGVRGPDEPIGTSTPTPTRDRDDEDDQESTPTSIPEPTPVPRPTSTPEPTQVPRATVPAPEPTSIAYP